MTEVEKGSEASVPFEALSEAEKVEVLQYAVSVKQEAAFLADELLVKNQTIIGLGNALAEATASTQALQQKLETTENSLAGAKEEILKLRGALQDAAPRTAELESATLAQDEIIRQLKSEVITSAAKLETFSKLEEDNKRLEAEHTSMGETLEVWKSRVKEALKEHRRKEQAQERTEIELKTQLNMVQTQLNEASFNLESYKLKEGRKEEGDQHQETQTEDDLLEELVQSRLAERAPPVADPFSPKSGRSISRVSQGFATPTLPMRSESRPNGEVTPKVGASSSAAEGALSPNPASPPPAPTPPMIMAVHFGTREGWTLDTKHAVKPGMTVTDLIRNCCNTINARYDQHLDETEMILKIHHGKAKRQVTLQEQRELHSFAVFHKYQKEGVPIVLSLDHKTDEPWDEFLSPRFTPNRKES